MQGKTTYALYIISLMLLGVVSFTASVFDSFPGDLEVSTWVQSWRTPWLDTLMESVSELGKFIPSIISLALIVGILLIARRPRDTFFLITATLLGSVANWGLKEVIARPRPSQFLVDVLHDSEGLAFPSGHAMHMTIFLGMLMFFIPMYFQGRLVQWAILSLLTALIILAGLSRIYLGAHWASDILGGYAFGLVILIAFIRAYELWPWGYERKKELESD